MCRLAGSLQCQNACREKYKFQIKSRRRMQVFLTLHPAAVFDSFFYLFNPFVIGVKELLLHMPQLIG